MNWKMIFRNARAEQLEERLIDERHEHHVQVQLILKLYADRVTSIENLHTTIEYEAMRERVELKKAHADELNHAIEECQKLRDDNERLRLLVTPALQNVELPKERSAPQPPSKEVFTGTPWQRILQREIAAQDRTAAAKFVKPADAPLEGESNGSTSERRVDAPLSGESKPA